MKRWLWFLAAILISTLVYSTIRYGLRPKPIPILNPTEFEDPQQIGAVVYRRLRQNIRPERLLVLGSSAELEGYDGIWTGFLKTARADEVQIDVFFQREDLKTPPALAGVEIMPYSAADLGSGKLLQEIMHHLQAGHLVVLHGLTREVSHLVPDSITRKLEEAVHHPVLSLSTVEVPWSGDELESRLGRCVEPQPASEPFKRLDCAAARVAKILVKKRVPVGHSSAVMERHGLQEYLIFVRRGTASASENR